jgi:hypothetical protein
MAERDPERLLAAYRSGLGPSRPAEDRMLASLQLQISVLPDPSGGGGAPSGGAGASGGVGASGGLAAAAGGKLAAVVLVASVVVSTVTVAVFGRDASGPAASGPASLERAPIVRVEPEPKPERVEPPGPTFEAVPAPAPASEPSEPATPTADAASSSKAPRSRASPRPRGIQASEVETAPPLADEAKLLRSIDAALRVGDLAVARTQLDDYRRTFASGSLRAQADELALLLACADQLDGASTHALDYLHAHPDTRARERIEDACGLR